MVVVEVKSLFGFFLFHHLSLITQFSSLINHHLKYLNFLHPTHLAHIFNFSSLNFFYFLWDPYLSTMSSILVCLLASHHFLPKPELQPRHSFFFFFPQPPIPITTTSVLSLKHKPTKFISILEAPRKFTNPQQPICCHNH